MTNAADVAQPAESRALKLSRSFALGAIAIAGAVVLVVVLATVFAPGAATFQMQPKEAFARVQARAPIMADDSLGAPIDADGKTYYSIAYNNGSAGESLRIYVEGRYVSQLQLRFETLLGGQGHGFEVIPLLVAVDPSLSQEKLLSVATTVEGLIRRGERGSIEAGNARVVVAAGGLSSVVTVVPLAAPDPLSQ